MTSPRPPVLAKGVASDERIAILSGLRSLFNVNRAEGYFYGMRFAITKIGNKIAKALFFVKPNLVYTTSHMMGIRKLDHVVCSAKPTRNSPCAPLFWYAWIKHQ